MLKEGTRADPCRGATPWIAIQSLHSTGRFRRASLQKKKGNQVSECLPGSPPGRIESGERVMPANRRHPLLRTAQNVLSFGGFVGLAGGRFEH